MSNYQPPIHTGLDIVHQDDDLLVLNKPAGLLSVPGRGEHKQDCLARRVQQVFPEALIVHRLDMATSGLLIMARNKKIHRQLNQLFEQRRIEKRYIAIVDGKLTQTAGEIDLPLITDWPNRPRQIVDHAGGKPALTLYRLLEYQSETHTSRVELMPQTGRTHQLRVHMQALGHAILGDRLYATEQVWKKSTRLLLHAEGLRFVHPVSEAELHLSSETPF